MNRERLEATRQSITHKGTVASTEFYLTVGMFEDGRPGELFITVAKEGSTMGGLYDSFGVAISMLLQSGWSTKVLAAKFKDRVFEPRGITMNPDIERAKSIVDYIFRWMELTFPEKDPIEEDPDFSFYPPEEEVVDADKPPELKEVIFDSDNHDIKSEFHINQPAVDTPGNADEEEREVVDVSANNGS